MIFSYDSKYGRLLRHLKATVDKLYKILFTTVRKNYFAGNDLILIRDSEGNDEFKYVKASNAGTSTGNVAWGNLSGLQPIIVGNNPSSIDDQSAINLDIDWSLLKINANNGFPGIMISNDMGLSYAGLIYASGNSLNITSENGSLGLNGSRIRVGQNSYSSYFGIFENAPASWDNSFSVHRPGSSNMNFNIKPGGDVYIPYLSSDETEEYVVAIDNSTGLLSKRSVISLGHTFENGLTESTGIVKLGGDITGNTNITNTYEHGVSNYEFRLNTTNDYSDSSSYIKIEEGYTYIEAFDGLTYSGDKGFLRAGPDDNISIGWQNGGGTVIREIGFSSTNILVSDGGNAGMYYLGDYSSGATDRWIPDKAYVDGVISAVYTFENGLTKTGNTVKLGGNLTGNTTIGIGESYGLNINTLGGYIDIKRPGGTSGWMGVGGPTGAYASIGTYSSGALQHDLTFGNERAEYTDYKTTKIGITYHATHQNSAHWTDHTLVTKKYVDDKFSSGLTDTIVFTDKNDQEHTVSISNGLITSWSIV